MRKMRIFLIRLFEHVIGSEILATDPEVRVRFPTLSDFLRSIGPGTRSTQAHEYN
jgi:hypothetical protein